MKDITLGTSNEGIGARDMNKSHVLKKAGAAVLAAAMMTGCSSGSGSSTSGSTLTVGISTSFNGIFSPLYYSTVYDDYVVEMVYQSMLTYDRDNQLETQLATEMPTTSDDGKTLTFKLNKGVKFSDGTKLTADDVVLTFKVMADPNYTGRFSSYVDYLEGYSDYHDGDAEDFAGVEKIDDYTVAFHMATPRIDAVSNLGTFPIISNSQFKNFKKGDAGDVEDEVSNPIGTGPYVLKNFKKDEAATFVKNEYFKAEDDEYQIDNVVMKICDTSTELQELEKGTVDMLPQASDANKVGSASLQDDLTFNYYQSSSMQYFIYNTAAGPTADQAVRQALTYAIDRQSFVDSYYGFEKGSKAVKKTEAGFVPAIMANPLSSTLGDVVNGYETDDAMTYYDYNIEKAKQILDEAGWTVGSDGIREKDGQKLTVRLISTKGKEQLDTMLPMLEKAWGDELGVDFQSSVSEFNTMVATVQGDDTVNDWEVSYMGWQFGSGDDTGANLLYENGQDDNYSRINDEELNSLLQEALYTTDQEASTAAYKKAYEKISELVPYVAINGVGYYDLYNKKLKGFDTAPLYDFVKALDKAYIED